MSSIITTVAALQELHRAVAGVRSAPTDRPVAVTPAQLPCLIVRPGALQVALEGRASTTRTRSYEGVALVAEPNSGRGVAEGLARSHALMGAMATAYAAHLEAGEELVPGAQVVAYRDGGEPQSLLSYGAADFEGFTFTIDVWEG